MRTGLLDKASFVKWALIIWIFIWVLFLIRPYFKKDLFKDYSTLLSLSLDEKRAYVTGKELYDFIKFCNDAINPPSSYKIIGLGDHPLDYRRAVYYLYPNVEKENSEFLLVYNVRGFSEKDYYIFKTLNYEKYILKKQDVR